MAGYILPRGTMTGLPNETLFQIAGYLGEPERSALSRVNRQMNRVAAPLLWDSLYNNPLRCQEVLLWAVDFGRHQLLQLLLSRGVSPNFLYLSPLLRSRLLNVLWAQRRHGAVPPRDDRTLQVEIFREKYCLTRRDRKVFIGLRRDHFRYLPMEQDMDWNLEANFAFPTVHADVKFGVLDSFVKLGNAAIRHHWTWAPIHVAVQHGDLVALRLLLEHGADVNAQCSGLCDCAVPDMTGVYDPADSVSPHRFRSIWTPLHVAICSGNEEAARLLISHKASFFVGNLVAESTLIHGSQRLAQVGGMTAIHNAAWIGSVQMCKMLLEQAQQGGFGRTKNSQPHIDHRTRREHTALHYAAAGGHIRTVGKFLLEKGAVFHIYNGDRKTFGPEFATSRGLINDALRLLCMQFRYGDAEWLIHFTRQFYANKALSQPPDHEPLDPVPIYNRALAAVCCLRTPAAYSRLSLRQQQDRLLTLTHNDISTDLSNRTAYWPTRQSESGRLWLAKTLLNLGADPNLEQPSYQRSMPIGYERDLVPASRTALQLAAVTGFANMVRLLLSRGADCNRYGDGRPLEELPVMLAVDGAIRAGEARCHVNLQTVEALLNAGTCLDDREQPILLALQSIRERITTDDYGRRASHQTFLIAAQMFLDHGAAHRTSQQNWERIVVEACAAGNLAYCRMLAASRPIDDFSEDAFTAMVVHAVESCWNPPLETRFYLGGPKPNEDTEMVGWACDQAADSNGERDFLVPVLQDLRGEATQHQAHLIADLLGDVLEEIEMLEFEDSDADEDLDSGSESGSELSLASEGSGSSVISEIPESEFSDN